MLPWGTPKCTYTVCICIWDNQSTERDEENKLMTVLTLHTDTYAHGVRGSKGTSKREIRKCFSIIYCYDFGVLL